MTPIIATAILGLAGMGAVIAFDLFTFVIAFITLAFCIPIPEGEEQPRKPPIHHISGVFPSANRKFSVLIENKRQLQITRIRLLGFLRKTDGNRA